jgi:protein-L-isoaspartate(D-aspartate) O-methyltransferase
VSDGAAGLPLSDAAALVAALRPAIDDERVLGAIAAIPRERFVPSRQLSQAYANSALRIDCGQTISQPLVVARMLTLLELDGTERVLDVGTGSGYHAALLSRMTAAVWSIERHALLSEQAATALRGLGLANIRLAVGDGAAGLPAHAPFDAINVAAAVGAAVPAALISQLADGGRLVAPVGRDEQRLVVLRRDGDRVLRRTYEAVRFVPLVASTPRTPRPRRGRQRPPAPERSPDAGPEPTDAE